MPRALQAGSRVVLLLGAAACGPEQQIDFPTPMFQASPIPYPIELWDQNLNGETVVLEHVTDLGGVDSVDLHDSRGYEAFDSA
ncbi:MAG: hypothetical protein HY703_02845, partial [Gemmatimonadetes bacterium]|nr:hypothetical protein [Gemmatimonadota bacterium]